MSWQAAWGLDPMEASRLLDERDSGQGVGGLLTWAVWTVEGLHYVADVDAALPTPPYKHNHEAVDLSHARRATVDAVSAIDLCSAALGRMHRGYPNEKQREMDFGIARNDGELSQLREPAAWINTVLGDDEYEEVGNSGTLSSTAPLDVALRLKSPRR